MFSRKTSHVPTVLWAVFCLCFAATFCACSSGWFNAGTDEHDNTIAAADETKDESEISSSSVTAISSPTTTITSSSSKPEETSDSPTDAGNLSSAASEYPGQHSSSSGIADFTAISDFTAKATEGHKVSVTQAPAGSAEEGSTGSSSSPDHSSENVIKEISAEKGSIRYVFISPREQITCSIDGEEHSRYQVEISTNGISKSLATNDAERIKQFKKDCSEEAGFIVSLGDDYHSCQIDLTDEQSSQETIYYSDPNWAYFSNLIIDDCRQ